MSVLVPLPDTEGLCARGKGHSLCLELSGATLNLQKTWARSGRDKIWEKQLLEASEAGRL